MELLRSDQADPKFARRVLTGLISAVVLWLVLLLLLSGLGDDVVHN